MKLEPRKTTDRGGWLCMPLVMNRPEGKPGWKKVHCPECGTLCWQRPEDAGVVKASHLDGVVCTKCALGVYVPDGMNYRGEWYDLKAIKKAKRKDRSRPVSEQDE